MEINGQFEAPGASTSTLIGEQSEWVPVAAWTLRRKEEHLIPLGMELASPSILRSCMV
jgi:hypothetical protein